MTISQHHAAGVSEAASEAHTDILETVAGLLGALDGCTLAAAMASLAEAAAITIVATVPPHDIDRMRRVLAAALDVAVVDYAAGRGAVDITRGVQ